MDWVLQGQGLEAPGETLEAFTTAWQSIPGAPIQNDGRPINCFLQGDGAWEPKSSQKVGPRAGPGRGRKRKNAELATTQTTSEEEEISDEDEEGDAKPVAAPAESRPASSSAWQKPQARKDEEPVTPPAAAEPLRGGGAEGPEPAAGEGTAKRGRRPSGKRAKVPAAELAAAGESTATDIRPLPGITNSRHSAVRDYR